MQRSQNPIDAKTVLQSASLCLTCTPAEELAVALRTLLRPFALLKVPVNEKHIGLDVLPKQHALLLCRLSAMLWLIKC